MELATAFELPSSGTLCMYGSRVEIYGVQNIWEDCTYTQKMNDGTMSFGWDAFRTTMDITEGDLHHFFLSCLGSNTPVIKFG